MIELVKPEWALGSEKRFFDFISELNDKDKIALISHNDLDGITAAKISNDVLNSDLVILSDYNGINDGLVEKLKRNKVTKVIFTDIGFTKQDILIKISKFAKVLVIDHHRVSEDYNSDKIAFLNAQDFCAGYLCYYLFSKIQDLETRDWLACCSCISDYLYFKNQQWVSKIFEKYGDEFILVGKSVRKEGLFWDLQAKLSLSLNYFKGNPERVYDSIGKIFGDIGDLQKYSDIVNAELSRLSIKYESEKEIINGIYYWEVVSKYPVKDILANIMSSKNPDKTFIFVQSENGMCKISARRQDRNVDLPKFLGKLLEGFENSSSGGHIPAAGGGFPEKYLSEFKKRLAKV